ncbi:MAG: hypothetical protein COV75_04335, partial [Candidatus Omnitrophica bacterium CG11_big_fil_rev_8_21_14_0_20_63_9]
STPTPPAHVNQPPSSGTPLGAFALPLLNGDWSGEAFAAALVWIAIIAALTMLSRLAWRWLRHLNRRQLVAAMIGSLVLSASVIGGWQALSQRVHYRGSVPQKLHLSGRSLKGRIASAAFAQWVSDSGSAGEAEALRRLAEDPIHDIPITDVKDIQSLRGIPRHIVKLAEDSAHAYQLPPYLVLTSVTAGEALSTSAGPLDWSLRILKRRGKIPPLTHTLLRVASYPFLSLETTPEWGDFAGGVIAGGKNTMGLGQMRPGWVRRYQGWKRFGIDANTLSDRQISWRLLEPRFSIEAVAAMWRGAAEEVKGFLSDIEAGRPLDFAEFERESPSGTMSPSEGETLYRRLAASMPELMREGPDAWWLAMHHPLHGRHSSRLGRFGEIAQPGLQCLVILSGLLDEKPGKLINLEAEVDVARVQRLGLRFGYQKPEEARPGQYAELIVQPQQGHAQTPSLTEAFGEGWVRANTGAKTGFRISGALANPEFAGDPRVKGEYTGEFWLELGQPINLGVAPLGWTVEFADPALAARLFTQVIIADDRWRLVESPQMPARPGRFTHTFDAPTAEAQLQTQTQERMGQIVGLTEDPDPYIRDAARRALAPRDETQAVPPAISQPPSGGMPLGAFLLPLLGGRWLFDLLGQLIPAFFEGLRSVLERFAPLVAGLLLALAVQQISGRRLRSNGSTSEDPGSQGGSGGGRRRSPPPPTGGNGWWPFGWWPRRRRPAAALHAFLRLMSSRAVVARDVMAMRSEAWRPWRSRAPPQ